MSVARVTGISIYPVKSTAGIALDASRVEPHGLANDRRWMVVDDAGEMLTGRELPMLTRVRASLEDGGLRLEGPGTAPLRVPAPAGAAMPVRVWDDECRALAAGEGADAWLSTLLGTSCRLVFMHDPAQRAVDFDYGRPGDRVSFADGFPLLLISEASLADLNTRLDEPASMRRFRPNVVVDGCDAYAEDAWRDILVGDTPFEVVKTCARCVFTTVDPDTGEKHPSLEPLRTLATYRRGPSGGPLFGQNLIPRGPGTIRVGDEITLLD